MLSLVVDIEVILSSYSPNISKKSITAFVQRYLENRKVRPNSVMNNFSEDNVHVPVKSVIVGNVQNYNKTYIDFKDVEIKWYVYTLDTYGPVAQNEGEDDEGEINIATHLVLPSADLFNSWENLYYDNNIKENLLKYAHTIMDFSDKGVDCNIVTCNRVILLHGPPGTGKTSLCKALAQKLTIRMHERYSSGLIIEINSHSLFSKWFSESGKLVTKMFSKIKEIVENTSVLVCVLIDEVESLAHARDQCISGNEPSDSIRVVNAVLTQLDQIKRHSNVLIFATSNMTEAIDLAFIDRADIKQFLGLPSVPAIYKIYHSCLAELIKAHIIHHDPSDSVEVSIQDEWDTLDEYCKKLIKICEASVGLSGRSLRKIPFIAHALFVNKSYVNITEFLDAMEQAVEREHGERKYFDNLSKK